MILQNLKATAEAYLGEKLLKQLLQFLHILMTHNVKQQKTQDELRVLKLNIVNEPTAAALAYGIDKTDKEQNNFSI